MGSFRTLDTAVLKGKRVLVRVDLNVPMADGRVTDVTRIDRAAATLTELADNGARVIVLSHFGRPKGRPVPEMSLAPVGPVLAERLGRPVAFAADCVGETAQRAVAELAEGGVLLLENTRFHAGEETNDPAFAETLARLGDLYVNDAFSAAHRAHASTEGLAHRLPALAGRAMEAELKALQAALTTPEHPVMAVVGGAKISTKLDLLRNLIAKVDKLTVGGAMANTFLAAQGVDVGASLCEHELGSVAREVLAAAENASCEVLLPSDVVVAKEFRAGAAARTAGLDAIAADDLILDVGPRTIARFETALGDVHTVVWNGPLGAFEIPPFDKGTVEAARAVALATAAGRMISVAGGGDTVAALNAAGVTEQFTYVSTAGGAFLEWLEGKNLPGVMALCPDTEQATRSTT